MSLLDFKYYPWENEVKPIMINQEGFEWYLDKDLTRYAHEPGIGNIKLTNIFIYFIRKDKDISRVIVRQEDGISKAIFSTNSLEDVGVKIDQLKLIEQAKKL